MDNTLINNPQNRVDKKRSVFDLSESHRIAYNEGDLVPLYIRDVLPGDTFSVSMRTVTRLSTPIKPVMDDCALDVYAFFVPNRLSWNHWEEFCGENKSGPWTDSTDWIIPSIRWHISPEYFNSTNLGAHLSELTFLDALGYLGALSSTDGAYAVGNILGLNAYSKVYNDWFRDENLTDFREMIGFDDNNKVITTYSNALAPAHVAKYHDYFTSLLPQPQKGDAVTLSLAGTAPIFGFAPLCSSGEEPVTFGGLAKFTQANFDGSDPNPANGTVVFKNTASGNFKGVMATSGTAPTSDETIITGSNLGIEGDCLTADLTSVSAFTINQLREAIATQAFYEASARGGSRYTEYLKAHFGVESGDSRLQRSEYLGGTRFSITTIPVPQTAATSSDSPQGNLAAYSVGGNDDLESLFSKTFVEHGKLLIVGCVRVRHSYSQGISRDNLRTHFLQDFYNPEFANIGDQPVYKAQIFADKNTILNIEQAKSADNTFGFSPAWEDYRQGFNRVHGIFRPDFTNNLSFWNYSDLFSSAPVLNDAFIKESKAPIARTLAINDPLTPQVFSDFYFNITAARVMPLVPVPSKLGL